MFCLSLTFRQIKPTLLSSNAWHPVPDAWIFHTIFHNRILLKIVSVAIAVDIVLQVSFPWTPESPPFTLWMWLYFKLKTSALQFSHSVFFINGLSLCKITFLEKVTAMCHFIHRNEMCFDRGRRMNFGDLFDERQTTSVASTPANPSRGSRSASSALINVEKCESLVPHSIRAIKLQRFFWLLIL